jgi:iron complex outermembrane recepter protein
MKHPTFAICALALLIQNAWTQEAKPVAIAQRLEPGVEAQTATIVISASRGVAQKAKDTPVSIDVIEADSIQTGQLQVNISETLARVPGLVAQNRQNYAQDIQISSRGFGARSAFGVRGLRLYADGIPATGPDGQGQVSHFDLASASRIEVLRGPFSALYGNSSGGVISIFTADGGAKNNFELSTAMGSFGTHRTGIQMSGTQGKAQYNLSAGFFDTGGYRDHSAAKRQNFNGKVKINLNDDTQLSFVVNKVDMPDVQDPLGLNRADMEANPRQVISDAYKYNTRKSVAQSQAGMVLDHRIDGDLKLLLTTYVGERATQQFQSIPSTTQNIITTPTSPGGVIDLKRSYQGIDLRMIQKSRLLDQPLTVTYGLSTDRLHEGRKGYQNYTGPAATPTATGIQGPLRRDEENTVRSMDQYVQAEWALAERWSLSAGLRHSRVSFDSKDNYITGTNGNDSGGVSYQANSPALGLVFHATESTNLYASAGKGFETPTLNELAYRAGTAGLNFGLQAASSNQWEVGVKSALSQDWRINTALFEARTSNEITVLSNSGGRAVYQNVGSTKRNGLEVALDGRLSPTWSTHVAATYLNARYANDFMTCSGTPCATANVPVTSGNQLPGIAKTSLFADLRWQPKDKSLETALEWRRVGKIYVNDTNSDTAPQVSLLNARVSFLQKMGDWSIKEFVRIDNLTRRIYAGSVIVNEGNSRFFEPAPGRNWIIGVSAAHSF